MPFGILRAIQRMLTGQGRAGSALSATVPSFEASTPDEILQSLFQGHGIDAVHSPGWVTFPGTPYRVSAEIVGEWRPTPSAVTVQLDVVFAPGQGRPIVESFAGVGTSRTTAVGQAFGSFAIASLHVLLTAFFDVGQDQMTIETWRLHGGDWQAIIGPAVTRGTASEPILPPLEWASVVMDAMNRPPLQGPLHWVRIYFAQMDRERLELETLLDNEPWSELGEALSRLEWPAAKSFSSVRLFLIVRSGDPAAFVRNARDESGQLE